VVTVGSAEYKAKLWYDGDHWHNAEGDAAEVTLKALKALWQA
jgi:hypothetical protein